MAYGHYYVEFVCQGCILCNIILVVLVNSNNYVARTVYGIIQVNVMICYDTTFKTFYNHNVYMGACQCFRTCVSFWIISNKYYVCMYAQIPAIYDLYVYVMNLRCD